MAHSSDLAVVSRALLESDTAPHRVLYFEDDGGYLVLDATVSDLDPNELAADALATCCVDCLLGEHPSVGRGLDVARRSALRSARFIPEVGDWLSESDG